MWLWKKYGTDKYFGRTRKILNKQLSEGELDPNVEVVAEVTIDLPDQYSFGILCGIDELLRAYKGKPLSMRGMEEGEIFFNSEPVLFIRLKLKDYAEFCPDETALIGELAQASGVASKAARVRLAAGLDGPKVISFGTRRQFPESAAKIERAAFIGGCDSFSNTAGEKLVEKKAVGTMPHALIIVNQSRQKAWKAFDKHVDKKVPRIALIDTYSDEKEEALLAARSLKNLWGVRLDTPGSRKGDFKQIAQEVRWELDKRGFTNIKLVLSGGLDEQDVASLKDIADYLGVGTSIAAAKPCDPSLNIVELDGKPVAKRGKLGGAKEIYRKDFEDWILPEGKKPKFKAKPIYTNLIKDGKVVCKWRKPKEIRKIVLKRLSQLPKKLKACEPLEEERVNWGL